MERVSFFVRRHSSFSDDGIGPSPAAMRLVPDRVSGAIEPTQARAPKERSAPLVGKTVCRVLARRRPRAPAVQSTARYLVLCSRPRYRRYPVPKTLLGHQSSVRGTTNLTAPSPMRRSSKHRLGKSGTRLGVLSHMGVLSHAQRPPLTAQLRTQLVVGSLRAVCTQWRRSSSVVYSVCGAVGSLRRAH